MESLYETHLLNNTHDGVKVKPLHISSETSLNNSFYQSG